MSSHPASDVEGGHIIIMEVHVPITTTLQINMRGGEGEGEGRGGERRGGEGRGGEGERSDKEKEMVARKRGNVGRRAHRDIPLLMGKQLYTVDVVVCALCVYVCVCMCVCVCVCARTCVCDKTNTSQQNVCHFHGQYQVSTKNNTFNVYASLSYYESRYYCK